MRCVLQAFGRRYEELLQDEQTYRRMATAVNSYGDALASERIVEVLRNWRCGRPLLAMEKSFSCVHWIN